MQTIREKQAYYPSFQLGGQPNAVRCDLRIVEANGKRYLKTPFAMLDVYSDDAIELSISSQGGGYYADESDCAAYLKSEYPNWETAAPIMDALCDARHYHGDLVGPGRLADKLGVTRDDLYPLARGHKRFTLKQVRAAVKRLAYGPGWEFSSILLPVKYWPKATATTQTTERSA